MSQHEAGRRGRISPGGTIAGTTQARTGVTPGSLPAGCTCYDPSLAVTKRTFLQLALAHAGACRLAAQRLTNWAGNLTYSTDRLHEPRTVDEVRALVRAHGRLKALGTRHCFSSIADSAHNLVSLQRMNGVAELDAAARTVTVEAGVRYGELCVYLHDKGFALANLASLPHISVAGACSTATHGSGETVGNLACAVAGIEFVNAAGDLVKLTRAADGETFQGAVVGLGALGVITKVTLEVQPAYSMRQWVYQDLPLEQAREHFDAIQASGYSVSLFTDWRRRVMNEVWVKSRREFDAPAEWFGGKRASRNLHPIAELPAENCTEQMGVPGPWYARLPHFKMGFTPSAGKELQAEYLLPRKHAVEAILAMDRLRDRIAPHLLISEIRTVAADGLWMSTAYRQPSVAIHFTLKPDWPAVRQLLPEIERELGPFGPRPHWGKLFAVRGAALRQRYEQADAFVALARRHDPKGKFQNEYLRSTVFP
ncbi:MAG TPA: FAD-binding protein [Solibacterales bacterium]|nr:FAD-binding protein [Bryobacterales bacterium]